MVPISIPTWWWRKAGRDFVLADCNHAAAGLMGKMEIRTDAGPSFRAIFHNAPQVVNDIEVCHEERFSFKREVRMRFHGATDQPYMFTYVAAPDGVVVHAERAVRSPPTTTEWHEEGATLRTIYQEAPLAILALDLQGRVTKWNRAAENIFGWKAEEVIGGICPTVPPEEMANYLAMIRQVVEQGPRTGMLFARKNTKDERMQASISAAPVRDATGAAVGLVVIMEDATARERAAKELAARKAELRSLVDNTGDIVMRLDRDFRYLLVNRAFLEFTSRTRDAVVGHTMEEAGLASDRCAFWRENVSKVFASRAEHSFEFELLVGDEMRSYHAKVAPEFDRDGMVESVVVIVRDITDRNRMAFEAQVLREKLAHITRVSAMGELATVLAHELNQPLTAILANAEAAKRLLASSSMKISELQEIMNDIAADDRRAGEIIRRMRGMLMKGESKFEAVDLNAVIREVTALTQADALFKGVEVTLRLASPLPPVRGDFVQLQQVLLNLFINAMEAMSGDVKERRLLVQTCQLSDSTVSATVEDTGVGVDSAKLNAIFEPFYTSKANGLGTGLFISRSIIESHGGRIAARQNVGSGATFEFTLPVHYTT